MYSNPPFEYCDRIFAEHEANCCQAGTEADFLHQVPDAKYGAVLLYMPHTNSTSE